ncbi:hypothetical protein HAX54_036077, partial [Datura stramonium]|nr:hypothetical protein [Datura stramonium]
LGFAVGQSETRYRKFRELKNCVGNVPMPCWRLFAFKNVPQHIGKWRVKLRDTELGFSEFPKFQ